MTDKAIVSKEAQAPQKTDKSFVNPLESSAWADPPGPKANGASKTTPASTPQQRVDDATRLSREKGDVAPLRTEIKHTEGRIADLEAQVAKAEQRVKSSNQEAKSASKAFLEQADKIMLRREEIKNLQEEKRKLEEAVERDRTATADSGKAINESTELHKELGDERMALGRLQSAEKSQETLRFGTHNKPNFTKADHKEMVDASKTAYPKHAELVTDDVPADVTKAIASKGLKAQLPSDGHGPLTMDEFSFVMDKMPPGTTPEQIIEKLARDPNGTVNNKDFDQKNKFERQSTGAPKPGDHYKIDIGGTPVVGGMLPGTVDRFIQPEDGDVVLRDIAPDKFTFLTVDNPKTMAGKHPLYGNRQMGFENLEDGGVKFFTRGAYRRKSWGGPDNGEVTAAMGTSAQNESWRAMLKGLSDGLVSSGGKMRPGSQSEQHFGEFDGVNSAAWRFVDMVGKGLGLPKG
jgi:hypothetical protein